MKPILNMGACLLLAALLTPAIQAQPSLQSTNPAANVHDAGQGATVNATFDQAMQNATASSMTVHGNFTGRRSGSFQSSGNTLGFVPGSNFRPGERVEVSLTDGLQASAGGSLSNPSVVRFRAAAGSGPGTFTTVVRTFGGAGCHATRLADIDGDGDLDAIFTGNIYENDGSGNFTYLTTFASGADMYDVEVGDVDGDGDLDIATAVGTGQSGVWLNDGSGNFPSFSGVGSASDYTYAIRLGDMDADGDLDVVVGNRNAVNSPPGAQNYVYLNDGNGNFTAGTWALGPGDDVTKALALGDFDEDGDLDVAVGNGDINSALDFVYLNNGSGFGSGIPMLGAQGWPRYELTWYLDTGDFNNDGHLDIVCGNFGLSGAQNVVYFGDGAGNFDAGETVLPGTYATIGIRFADMDGDGSLDVITGNNSGDPCYLHFNDGSGGIASSVALNSGANEIWGVDAGDVDGDGDLDLLEGNNSGAYTIRLNGQTASQSAPTISVTAGGNVVTDGGAIQVASQSTLAALALSIGVDDTDGDSVSLAGSISNLTTQGISVAEFSSTTAATPYTLTPTSGSFNQPSTTHTVTLVADDGGLQTNFSFSIVVSAPPPAEIYVYETNASGTQIQNGDSASGLRDFGTVTVGTSAASSLTVFITNGGGQDLNLGLPQLSGPAAGDFAVDITGYSQVIVPGANTSFSVLFTPTADGPRAATVSFTHNGINTTMPFEFAVTGTGTTPPANPGGSSDDGGSDNGGGGCVALDSGACWWVLGLLLLATAGTLRRRKV